MRSVTAKSAFASVMDEPSAKANSHKPSRLLRSSAEAAIAAHAAATTASVFILYSFLPFAENVRILQHSDAERFHPLLQVGKSAGQTIATCRSQSANDPPAS
jgi:hypothetical protein